MINAAHAHLLVNHLPLMAFLIAVPLLVYALIARSTPQAFRAAVIVMVLGAFGSINALRTGDGAKELVEPMADVEPTQINEHEEQGETAAVLSFAVTALAIVLVVVDRKKPHLRVLFIGIGLLATIAALLALARASHSGGLIRHQESRAEFDPSAPPKGEPVDL